MSTTDLVPRNISQSLIIPGLRYRNAPAAIEWLCKAFAFEKHLVIPGPDNTIAHAQLTFGHSMIMLGSGQAHDPDNDVYSRSMKYPDEAGGSTQSSYVIVADADAHYARAKAAGAVIILENKDQDYGGRGYTCRDFEGHVWSFGTYNPWHG